MVGKTFRRRLIALENELAEAQDQGERKRLHDLIGKMKSDLRAFDPFAEKRKPVKVPMPKSYKEEVKARKVAADKISGKKSIRVKILQGGASDGNKR